MRNFEKNSKVTKIWGWANFFVISVKASQVCYLDSQSNFLRFEPLIDVVAQKLMELWQFQNLTYFLTSWPSYLTYILVQRTCRNHRLVLAWDQVWWWLADLFLRFCEISVQTNRETNRQTNRDKHDQRTYLPKCKFGQFHLNMNIEGTLWRHPMT